ncbi:MAG: threonine/serine exporter family protein, partial [Vallitaleaceae bacterium]|nr:threonine/serine exporter family protein [Vallitaleaceae bacterium]
MMAQIAAAFFGTLAFAVVFNISRYQLLYCGVVGGFGWFIYLTSYKVTGDIVFSSFIASTAISIVSHILARVLKNPVTIYQIGGIFPLVPGAGIYKTLYYIVSEDYTQATYFLYQTLQIAGGIAVGMVLIASFNRLILKEKGQNDDDIHPDSD